jgi:hypothetical protein
MKPSLALVVLVAAPFATHARAALPEDAPPESRDQVAAALRALRPAFAPHGRKLASGSPGTIEHAIGRYAPAKFHPVTEGSLPATRAGLHCPPDMAAVGTRFCVDRFEGSIVEKVPGEAEPKEHPPYERLEPGHVYVARSKPGVLPQAYISAAQASAACGQAEKRLCQPVEWRAACGGAEGLAFPYGPTRVPGTCHDSGTAPMLVYHADTLKKGWGPDDLNDPRLNQLDGTVAKTGAFPGCVNDFGIFDMVGNLHEWTADPNGTFQGGFWLDTAQHGDGCAYRTIAHEFEYHDYSTGFRCCADGTADPAPAPVSSAKQ